MAQITTQKLKDARLFGMLAGVVLFALVFQTAQAFLVSAPQDPILEGDITTTEILDHTLIDADVSMQANLSLSKIGSTTTLLIPFSASSTALTVDAGLLYDPNFNALLVGSSTLSITATTSGAIYANHIETGTISATSTTIFNDVSYTWPSADGAANEVLSTNGAGVLSWGSSGDWLLLGRNKLETASSGLAVSIPAREHLRVFIMIPTAPTGSPAASLQFNNDTDANYAWEFCEASATPACQTGVNARVGIICNGAMGSEYVQADILSIANAVKLVRAQCVENNGVGTAPETYDSTAIWNNTTASTTIVKLNINDGDQVNRSFPAGTIMRVYGSSQ